MRDTQPTLAGALYFARDEVGDCNKFTQGLAAACAARGVQFRYGDTSARSRRAGGRVTGVVDRQGADRRRHRRRRAWAASPRRCSPRSAAVPIYPVKGVSITFPRGGWNSAPQMPVIDDSKLFGFVPIGDRMRISGSAEITGYDTTPAIPRGEATVARLHVDRDAVLGGWREATRAGVVLDRRAGCSISPASRRRCSRWECTPIPTS